VNIDLPVVPTSLAVQSTQRRPRVVFLFKRGRKDRIGTPITVPTEFFYGYMQLREAGITASIVDEADIGLNPYPSLAWRIAIRLCYPIVGINPWMVWQLHKNAHLLRSYDVVVTTTNYLGLDLAFIARFGKVPQGIVFIAMGLMRERESLRRVHLYRRLLGRVLTVLISRGELSHLQSFLGTQTRLRYMPFGIDHRFWTPDSSTPLGDYVLSVGNDRHRDYETLVAAWKPHFPKLKIVTRLPVKKRQENIELITGDWHKQYMADAELRELVRGALIVVLPIHNTIQPSGQSVCLQAMACGKAVVLSDIRGLWDRDIMRNDMNCILVPPGEPEALSSAIAHLLNSRADAIRLGAAARATVVSSLNVDIMAAALYQLCLEASGNGAAA